MNQYTYIPADVSELAKLEQDIAGLELTVEYMAQAVTDVEKERDNLEAERDALADVFDSLSEDWETLDERIALAISDLRTLSEVPLNELESSIDAIIGRLRGEL
jgi:predicted nuclease with TOPRIM domain